MKLKIPFCITKWFHFEFWPFWFFYSPVYAYGVFLALKAKSFSYFTATNPGMKFGGAFDMDKIKILNKIDKKYSPKGFLSERKEDFNSILTKMQDHKFWFPIVCKPNVGERGIGVEKIDSKIELKQFLTKQKGDILIQEFVTFPIELGIFYHRFPISKKDGINSEPAHIYDPAYSLIKAYKEIIKHMRLVYDISMENRKLGIEPDSFAFVLKGLYNHLFHRN